MSGMYDSQHLFGAFIFGILMGFVWGTLFTLKTMPAPLNLANEVITQETEKSDPKVFSINTNESQNAETKVRVEEEIPLPEGVWTIPGTDIKVLGEIHETEGSVSLEKLKQSKFVGPFVGPQPSPRHVFDAITRNWLVPRKRPDNWKPDLFEWVYVQRDGKRLRAQVTKLGSSVVEVVTFDANLSKDCEYNEPVRLWYKYDELEFFGLCPDSFFGKFTHRERLESVGNLREEIVDDARSHANWLTAIAELRIATRDAVCYMQHRRLRRTRSSVRTSTISDSLIRGMADPKNLTRTRIQLLDEIQWDAIQSYIRRVAGPTWCAMLMRKSTDEQYYKKSMKDYRGANEAGKVEYECHKYFMNVVYPKHEEYAFKTPGTSKTELFKKMLKMLQDKYPLASEKMARWQKNREIRERIDRKMRTKSEEMMRIVRENASTELNEQ